MDTVEIKKKRVKILKVDAYVEKERVFGWDLQGKEDVQENGTVVVVLKRDRADFTSYEELCELERDYEVITRPYPLTAFIFLGIGLISLLCYFLLKTFFLYIIFLFVALTCFAIAFFALLVFFLILFKKKKILKKLAKDAGRKSGIDKSIPAPRNIEKEEEYTWAIENQIK